MLKFRVKYWYVVKILFNLYILSITLVSCTTENSSQNSNKKRLIKNSFRHEPPVSLSSDQEMALEALNIIQVNSKGLLYSTFVGSMQPCENKDTSFFISSDEFLEALNILLSDCCENLHSNELLENKNKAILAQERYHVEQCFRSEEIIEGKTHFYAHSGTWVIRNVLGHRDIILEW